MTRRGWPSALVGGGTVLLAVGALLRWWTVQFRHPLLGDRITTVTGREAVPALLVLAAISAAGLGASLAARGLVRRLVGALLVAAGVFVIIATVSAARTVPAAAVELRHPQAIGLPAAAFAGSLDLLAPICACLGAGLIVVGGVLMVLVTAGGGLPRRFDRTPSALPPTSAAAADADAVAADLWKQLSAGEDPTAR